MFKKLLFFFVSLLLTITHFSYGQDKWPLDKCITYAQQNNIQLKQAELSTVGAGQIYFQSKLNLLPTLNGTAQYGLNNGKNIDPTSNLFVTQQIQSGNFALNASVKLFGGFSKINELRQKYADYMASQFSTLEVANNISLYVANAYLQILFTQEQLANAKAQKGISDQQETRTKILVDAGTLSSGALYDIQAQVATDELSMVTAQNQLDIANLNLQQLLNLDKPIAIVVPELNVSTEEALALPSLEDIYNQALTTQPQIKGAEFKNISSQKALATARGGLYPSLSLFASLSTSYSSAFQQLNPNSVGYDTAILGFVVPSFEKVITLQPRYSFEKIPLTDQLKENFGQGVGLQLNVPIFNNWYTRANIAQSKLNLLNAQYNLDLEKQTLKKNVQTAYTDAIAAKNKYAATTKTEQATELSFNYAQQKYDVGLMNSVDYITAKNNMNTAKSNLLQSKYDYIFRLKVLDFYQGKPINLP